MSDMTLLVIAKSPVAGRVKTRLCPPCTPEQAAQLAAAAIADTLDVVANVPAARRVLVLDGEPGPWIPDAFEVVPQVEGGLDERLADAFAQSTGPAFLVGMDTPQIDVALLRTCIETLVVDDRVDAVLGRAEDGGWWSAGLMRPDPAAFLGVPMSTDTTGAEQHARFVSLGWKVADLPVLRDVDTFADAVAVANAAPASRFARILANLALRSETAPQ